MRASITLIVIVLGLASGRPATAGTLGLGVNFVFSAINPEFADDLSVIGWPGAVTGFQPGLRIAYLGEARTHEGYLDTGMLRLSGSGERVRYFQLTGNYQYTFSGKASVSPFVTAGGGIYSISAGSDFGSDISETTETFGGGAGVRHRVGGDHGSLRAEARFDRVIEGDSMIDAAGIFSLRLGFDLWTK